ncbi:MAG: glutamyl-tRNA reductase [Myxococcales bacterium]|nr:glutamyl-tRNA reductase [Myxococcales bacterium]
MTPAELFVVGLSWRTAPVAVREHLAFAEDELVHVLADVRGAAGVAEAMVLSTCNRVEVYGAAAPGEGARALVEVRRALVARRAPVPPEVDGALYGHVGPTAIEHVFRVAAALDSLVVGEAQILGQLKEAHARAAAAGAVGPLVGRCLERAWSAAKRVRTETAIARGAANVSTVAVELAARVFGDLAGKRVLVVGAGKMSTLAARHLRAAGVSELVVTNRSPERATALAAALGAVARPWEQLSELLATADVVVSSTGARQPVLTKALMKKVTKDRRWRPMVIVDIAVPRDAEPAVGDLDGVYLFDIDDLERVVAANLAERGKAAAAAGRIVDGEVAQFHAWLRAQKVVPTIRALRDHFGQIGATEADKVCALLAKKDLGPAERDAAVRRAIDLVIAKLLHHPQVALKDDDGDALARAVRRLFPIESVAPTGAAVADEHPAAEGGVVITRPAIVR